MPTRKRHLNRVEQAQYLAALQELRVAGFDLDVPYQWQESRFLDIQVAEGPASTAFRMPNFGIGYAIYVRMVATGARLSLLHCQVRTAWDDQIALLNVEERDKIVRFGWLKFSRNEILNQKFDSSLHFHYRGQMVEGMILAIGCQAIPATYGKRAQIPFLLTVTDSLGREVDVKGELYFEEIAKGRNPGVRRGTGLYEPLTISQSSAESAREDRRPTQPQRFEGGHPEQYPRSKSWMERKIL